MAHQVNFSKGMLFYKDCCPNSFEVHRNSPGAIFSFYMYHEERQIYEKNTVIGKNITANDLGIFIFFFFFSEHFYNSIYCFSMDENKMQNLNCNLA